MVSHTLSRDRTRLVSTSTAIFSLVLAFLGLGSPTAAHAAYDPGAIEKSIVQVYTEWSGAIGYVQKDGTLTWVPEPEVIGGSCSGAFVSTRAHISTAGHCVDDSDQTAIGNRLAASYLRRQGATDAEIKQLLPSMRYDPDTLKRTVYAFQNDEVEGSVLPPRGLIVEVVAFQKFKEGDNALLQVNNFSKETPALPVTDGELAIGDKITAIGFPGIVREMNDASRQRASFKSGEVSSHQTLPSGVAFVETSAPTSQGMSGGPVVNGHGEVTGSTSYGPTTREIFNFSTTGLREFLLTHGVALAEPAPPAPVGPMHPVQ